MNSQIALSFELVSLINWIVRNEKSLLNNLVKHAIEHGFGEELSKINVSAPQPLNDQMVHSLLDFLEFLEESMLKNFETINVDHKTKDAILPTLQKLESTSLDFKTIWTSLQQTKARINKHHTKSSLMKSSTDSEAALLVNQENNETNVTTILFEQLLKNWKPNNKETLN